MLLLVASAGDSRAVTIDAGPDLLGCDHRDDARSPATQEERKCM